MLTFDHAQSCFLLEGIAIGPGLKVESFARAFKVDIKPLPGRADWAFVERKAKPVNCFITAFRGAVHSGYFWIDVPSGGWENYERAEQQRRAEHERLMHQLFGAPSFKDGSIDVKLLRDPRSGPEQIAFDVTEAPAAPQGTVNMKCKKVPA